MNVCVFCGSSMGDSQIYLETASELGLSLAKENFTLVYGGGNVGLMGILADSVMQQGGKVIGVIPDFLMRREVGHHGITSLEVVGSMHERKKRMADLADAFVAMPGGWGTLDELAEILTWKQLGVIDQPVAILNVAHFFSPLLQQMNRMVESGFLRQENLSFLKIIDTPSALISWLKDPA